MPAESARGTAVRARRSPRMSSWRLVPPLVVMQTVLSLVLVRRQPRPQQASRLSPGRVFRASSPSRPCSCELWGMGSALHAPCCGWGPGFGGLRPGCWQTVGAAREWCPTALQKWLQQQQRDSLLRSPCLGCGCPQQHLQVRASLCGDSEVLCGWERRGGGVREGQARISSDQCVTVCTARCGSRCSWVMYAQLFIG